MSRIHKGDRVRMSAEGIVRYATDQEVDFLTDAGETVICHPSEVVLVEPKYEHDGIYQDARGRVFRRTKNNGTRPWMQIVPWTGMGVSHDVPCRPLRRMEPVS